MLIVHIITPAGALRRRGARTAVLLWRAIRDHPRVTPPVSGTLIVWLTLERVCLTPHVVCPTPERVCLDIVNPARCHPGTWRTYSGSALANRPRQTSHISSTRSKPLHPIISMDSLRVGWLNRFHSLHPQGHEPERVCGTSLGGVPREQKMHEGHLHRVIYHQVY